jgi:type VI protein secretion system component VasF
MLKSSPLRQQLKKSYPELSDEEIEAVIHSELLCSNNEQLRSIASYVAWTFWLWVVLLSVGFLGYVLR